MSASPRSPHLRVFGFPIRVNPMFWLVAGMFGALSLDNGQGATDYSPESLARVLLWVVIVFVSILWHELGHAFVARAFGFTPAIELNGMGGLTIWGGGPTRPTPGQRVAVSLAGPGFGLALGGVVYLAAELGLGPQHWALAYAIELLLWVNVGWGLLNLVPMLPWDGGGVLYGVLDLVTGGKGRKPAALVTIALSLTLAAVIVWQLGFTRVWLLFLCALSFSVGLRLLRAKPAPAATVRLDPLEAIGRTRQALEQAGPPERLVSAILMGARSESWAALGLDLEERVAVKVVSPSQRAVALELAAWAHLLAGQPDRAARAVEAMRATHDPSPILGATVALTAGRYAEALDRVEAIHPEEREGARLVEAYALAAHGRPESAMAPIGADRAVGALVDAALFHAGEYDAAAQLAALLFDRFGEAEDAYNAACSHARGGRPEEGLGWLERAIDAGYRDLPHLEADEDLASVRALADFAALRARLQ